MQLGEIAERVTQKNYTNNTNVLTISAQHGLISQLDFFSKSVASKNLKGYYCLNKDDFAYNKSYSKGYPMGAIKRLEKYNNGVVSTLYICFRFNTIIYPIFIEKYFDSGIQNKELEKITEEGARNHGLLNISISNFFKILLNIPSLPEQQKIATFLSLIDERIITQKNLIDDLKFLLEGYVKYLILSKKANKKINQCVNCFSSTIKESDILNKKGIYPVYGASGIIGYSSMYQIFNESILIIKDGASVGKVYFAYNKSSVVGTLNYLIPQLNICAKYIYFLLKYFNFNKFIVGSGIPHIYFKDYSHENIFCPSLIEQEQITQFLSSLEDKIQLEQSLLEKYELQKKYFLKKLFI